MAYIDLTAIAGTNISGPGQWNGTANTSSLDSTYATLASGVTLAPIYLYNFTPTIPKDISITGIEVNINAFVTAGSGTPVLTVQLVRDTSLAIISDSKITATLTPTAVTQTLGASGDLWNSDLKRYEASGTYFGLLITPSGSNNVKYSIDYVSIRLYYTTTGYLTGSRSKFGKRNNTLYDVGPNSNIEYKTNGTSITSQIRAEDINKLGDAIFNMEQVALAVPVNNNPIFVKGSQEKMFATTISVTGTITTPVTGVLSYQRFYNSIGTSITGASTTGITTSARSNLIFPETNKMIKFVTISAIGWVTSGSVVTPLYVQPNFSYSENYYGTTGYHLSFMASTKDPISTSTTTNLTFIDIPGYDRAIQVDSFGTIPSGDLTIKIFALGRYNFGT